MTKKTYSPTIQRTVDFRHYFHYVMDVDYDTDRDCNEHGCNDEGICRCARIYNVKILSVGYDRDWFIVNEHYRDAKGANRTRPGHISDIEKYCLDRLARVHKIYDKGYYDVQVGDGYYGEEITGVEFQNKTKMFKDMDEMLAMESDIDRIKFVLTKEYSYLLPELVGTTTVKVVEVNFAELLNARDYFMRVKRNEIADYAIVDNTLPVAVIYNGRLIDGYHRVAKTYEATPKIKVIELC